MIRTSALLAIALIAAAAPSYAMKPVPAASPHVPPLAIATTVTVTADNTGYTLHAEASLPRPCDNAKFSPGIRIDPKSPPMHSLLLIVSPKICADVVTPKSVSQHFLAKPLPRLVIVRSGPTAKPKVWRLPIIIEQK
jgi:hypothetical protein